MWYARPPAGDWGMPTSPSTQMGWRSPVTATASELGACVRSAPNWTAAISLPATGQPQFISPEVARPGGVECGRLDQPDRARLHGRGDPRPRCPDRRSVAVEGAVGRLGRRRRRGQREQRPQRRRASRPPHGPNSMASAAGAGAGAGVGAGEGAGAAGAGEGSGGAWAGGDAGGVARALTLAGGGSGRAGRVARAGRRAAPATWRDVTVAAARRRAVAKGAALAPVEPVLPARGEVGPGGGGVVRS